MTDQMPDPGWRERFDAWKKQELTYERYMIVAIALFCAAIAITEIVVRVAC